MISKEEIKQAKERAENIQTATLKSNEKAIQETQKFYETLETCNELLQEIKNESATLFENQKVLSNSNLTCAKMFKEMSESIENTTKRINNLICDFKDSLNNTSEDLKIAIHNDITENLQNEMQKIKQNTSNFNGTIENYKTKLDELVNNLGHELETATKKQKEQMEKETLKIVSGNKFLFFFFIFLSLIPSIYCLNYQFNFIPVLSQQITSEYIKGLITTPIAVIVLIIIIAIFKGLFAPKQKSYY